MSVGLSFPSLFEEDNAPDLMHQQYVSVFAMAKREVVAGEGVMVCQPAIHLSTIFQSSIHYAFDEGLSRWTISEALRKKKNKTKRKTIYALRGRCGVVAECKVIILLWKGSWGCSPYLATMIQLSVTNHWSPCQKQGHSVPHYSFLLYCVMHHPWNGDLMDTRPAVVKSQANTLYLLSVREISIIKAASCL